MAQPRVLLTGFGPFPGFAENPSAWLAETLGKRKPSPEFELLPRVLTTAWEDVALVSRLYTKLEPQALIHFGVCRRSPAFYIERSAHNRAARAADARGTMPDGRTIRAGGPQRFDTPFPAAALAAHLRRNAVAARISRSCGAYLCNFLYYHSLEWAQRQGNVPPVIFVHIPPWTKRRGPCGREALLHGASEVLRFVLAYANGEKPLKTQVGTPMSRSEPGLNAKGA
jgi:pyroglutamyl-peptidase